MEGSSLLIATGSALECLLFSVARETEANVVRTYNVDPTTIGQLHDPLEGWLQRAPYEVLTLLRIYLDMEWVEPRYRSRGVLFLATHNP